MLSTTTDTGREQFTKQWDNDWLQHWYAEGEKVAGIDEQFTDWRQQLTLIAGQSRRQLKCALSSMDKSRDQVTNQAALSFLMRYTNACLQRVLVAKQRGHTQAQAAVVAGEGRSQPRNGQYDTCVDHENVSDRSPSLSPAPIFTPAQSRSGCGAESSRDNGDQGIASAQVDTSLASVSAEDMDEFAWLQHWYAEGEKVAGIDEQFTDWRQQMYFITSQSQRKLERAL